MKFIADRMLGKLAKQLRMLGYDTVYYRSEDAYPLIKLAREEGRVILTRSTKLTPRRPEDRIVRIMEDKPSRQLRELIQREIISLHEEPLFPAAFCVTFSSMKSQGRRQKEKCQISFFINKRNFLDARSVREYIGRGHIRII